MKALMASLALGIAWNVLAFYLATFNGYSSSASAFTPERLGAGLVAALTAGAFTVWTSRKKKGTVWELFTTIATYYLAVCVWWMALGFCSWLVSQVAPGNGRYLYDFADELAAARIVLIVATLYTPVLVPFCWLSRYLVRRQIKHPRVSNPA